MKRFIPSYEQFLNEAANSMNKVLDVVRSAQSAVDGILGQLVELEVSGMKVSDTSVSDTISIQDKKRSELMKKVWESLDGKDLESIDSQNIRRYIDQYAKSKVVERMVQRKREVLDSGMSEESFNKMYNMEQSRKSLQQAMDQLKDSYSNYSQNYEQD